MSLPYFLISPLEAVARVSYEWHCIYSPDLVFSYFVIAVAVVWAPRTIEPFLFLWYPEGRMTELCTVSCIEQQCADSSL
jgi:hypothetical protein